MADYVADRSACRVRQAGDRDTRRRSSDPDPHTRTFSVVERDGYRIVDLHANIVTWGGAANGPEQRVRVVLVPRSIKAPALTGDLAGAVMVRTPVKRIAVNYGGSEALLTAIGAADRLVAVGGTKSYDDTIRERVKKGKSARSAMGGTRLPTSTCCSRPSPMSSS
ncbi:hypothetical protein MOP88_11470 [Sphingomonas sp. WKB10]|nr:hypothetical protein [Sphingomonas sp. WKB10]